MKSGKNRFGSFAGWLIGGLFLWAGVAKMVSAEVFLSEVRAFGLFCEIPAFLVLSIPVLECLLGLALLLRVREKASWLASLALLSVFSFWLLWGWASGEFESCGCFGDLFQIPLEWALVRNAALLAICWLAWKKQKPSRVKKAREG